MILNQAVEAGTGRRAIVEGVKAAGKTGTTNAYRDAWFAGYTGNMVAAVWYGNDDYAPTNRMTGGSLPAMTWQKIMAYAHQGIELKQMPGVPPSAGPVGPPVAARPGDEIPRPTLLTKKGVDVLVRIERALEDASQALGGPAGTGRTVDATPPASPPARSDGVVAATEGRGRAVRGN
jgi:penicillin-binding protein 1A